MSTRTKRKTFRTELLQGTLDLLILRILQGGRAHGWEISGRIQAVSKDVLQANQGSLYPALHRLERKGWVRSEWGASDKNRRAKFYRLTPLGRLQLAEETEIWERYSGAIFRVLKTA